MLDKAANGISVRTAKGNTYEGGGVEQTGDAADDIVWHVIQPPGLWATR